MTRTIFWPRVVLPRCAWCGRTGGAMRSPSLQPLIGGGYECKNNVACAARMAKRGL
jgi:hypothetical protein